MRRSEAGTVAAAGRLLGGEQGTTVMPRLDRASARALVESGYMPLSDYTEMFEPQFMLQQVPSPSTAPGDKWEQLEQLLISTTFEPLRSKFP
jgi:hypothetical protein